MSPNAVKITSGCSAMDKPVVDSSHGKHADRTTRPVDQFDVGRQQILQAKPVDGVSVSAAYFHEPVVPLGIGQPADLVGGPGDQLGFAKLVDKSHGQSSCRSCRVHGSAAGRSPEPLPSPLRSRRVP